MKKLAVVFVLLLPLVSFSQTVKILFDCTKAETAGNADWVIDADLHNIDWGSNDQIGSGTASNPQRYPTPLQSTITSTTAETYWEGALSSWGIDCVNYGYEVETLPPTGLITYGDTSNPQDLSNYKVYVVDEPNIRFTQTEKNAMLNFVKNGGGLFMISDHNISDRNNDGWDSPNIWNDFLNTVTPVNPFGIKFDLEDFSPSTTNVATSATDSLTRGPYGSVAKLTYSGATIMHIYPDSNSTATGDIWMSGVSQSSHDSIMFSHAHYGLGKVAAIADSSPEDDGTGNPACTLYSAYSTADNGSDRNLLMNAIIWLAETTTPTTVDTFDITGTEDTTICAGSSITISAHGATSYVWQPGNYTTASITVTPTVSTSYIVTGTTGNVVNKDTVVITVDPFPNTILQITPSSSTTICQGNSVTLAAPAGYASYTWNTGSGLQSISATQAQSYYFTATNANRCRAKSDTVQVTIDAFSQTEPQISASGPLTFCTGSSVTLTAPAQTSYQWSNNSTLRAITVNQSGTFFATVTDAGGCHVKTDTVTVLVDAFAQTEPQITANGPLSFCQGGNVSLSAPAGDTYRWNNNSTQQTITVTQSGSFFLTVTDANNCFAKSDTLAVDATSGNFSGIQVSPSLDTVICSGNNIVLSAPTGYTYLWNTGSTQQSITVSQQGNYYFTVTAGSNCHGMSDTATISVDDFSNITPQLSTSGPSKFCGGDSVVISAPAGNTYQWSTGSQQQSITATQSGVYQTTVTDSHHCSAASQALTVTVNPLPQVSFTVSPDSICSNASPLGFHGTPTGGIYSGTGVSNLQFEPAIAGTGTFTITYIYTDSNQCSNSAYSNVVVYVCTGIQEIDNNQVSVYPNPSSGGFTFETTQGFIPDGVKVFDEMGRPVMEIVNTGNQNQMWLNMKSYASGIYIAVFAKGNETVRKKLVKTE